MAICTTAVAADPHLGLPSALLHAARQRRSRAWTWMLPAHACDAAEDPDIHAVHVTSERTGPCGTGPHRQADKASHRPEAAADTEDPRQGQGAASSRR